MSGFSFVPEFVIFETLDVTGTVNVPRCDVCHLSPATLYYCIEESEHGGRCCTTGRCCTPCTAKIMGAFSDRQIRHSLLRRAAHGPTDDHKAS